MVRLQQAAQAFDAGNLRSILNAVLGLNGPSPGLMHAFMMMMMIIIIIILTASSKYIVKVLHGRENMSQWLLINSFQVDLAVKSGSGS